MGFLEISQGKGGALWSWWCHPRLDSPLGKDPSEGVSLPQPEQEDSEEPPWLSDTLRTRYPPLTDLHPG